VSGVGEGDYNHPAASREACGKGTVELR